MNPLHFITNASRATEIVFVLVRNGFLEFLEQIEVPPKLVTKLVHPRADRLNQWQRIRVTAEELGPTFVKFAQMLSARPDVLPQPLIDELKLLRSQVTPVPWEQMRPFLEHELKGPVEEVFAEFDPEPVAAGSIGQVYRAKLRSGEAVAIKVQRPGIRKEIKADLEIIQWFAHKMQLHLPELRAYDLPAVVAEAGDGILRELDFTIEARNTDYFNATNPFPTEIFAPKVYHEFTSRQLLVLEWIDGVSPEKVVLDHETRARLAALGGRSTFHQIIIAGFFHADPHTGNLLITPDQRLCLIDWGLAGQLTRNMRYFLADLFSAVATQNAEKVVQVVLVSAVTKHRVDATRLEKDVSIVLRKYPDTSGENLGRTMIDLLYVFGSNGIQLARDYSLLAKAVIAIAEAGRTLDPEFDIRVIAQPFLRQLNVERWHPKTVAGLAFWDLRAILRQVRELPGSLSRFLRNLEDGEAHFHLTLRGQDDLLTSFEHGVNRLVLAIIIAATLLSSALIVSRIKQEDLAFLPWHLGTFGYSVAIVLGTFGFVFAIILGFWLLYEIFREARKPKRPPGK